MLNGLKKIVGSKTEEEPCPSTVTPDLLLTPTIYSFVRKRKAENGLSAKQKKAVINKLPDCALLNTPFTPSRTPVSVHPNGKKNNEEHNSLIENHKEKQFNMRSSSMKNLKDDKSMLSSVSNSRRNSLGPKSMIERISSATFRKKRRNSCAAVPKREAEGTNGINKNSPDYVRVSKKEYEELGNRVLAMERKIQEFDNAEQIRDFGSVNSLVDSDNDNNVNQEIDMSCENNIESVQTAYEKTLDSASLSPTTDQLARRLSRDLGIRRSIKEKVIRSPSARKIGTIRRRSSEREKKNTQIIRNQSWHVGTKIPIGSTAPLIPRVSMRRKKNQEAVVITKMNLDPQETPPPDVISQPINLQRSTSYPKRTSARKSKSSLPRVSSSPSSFTIQTSFIHQSSPQCARPVHLSDSGMSQATTYNTSGSTTDHWVSAEGFFSAVKTPLEDSSGNARASIAKLRSQNIGMVRAKARLFDNHKESDSSCSSVQSTNNSRPGSANRRVLNKSSCYKVGSPRLNDSTRISYRIKALRSEDRRSKRSTISPRRRHVNMSQKQRLQHMGRQYAKHTKDSNSSMDMTQDSLDLTTPRKDLNSLDTAILSPRRTPNPHNVPYIKMPLTVKTPKRLCRTPGVDRKTPFKVTATPI